MVFFSVALDPVNDKDEELRVVSDEFTVPAGTTDLALFARLGQAVGTGGNGLGDAMLHRLSDAERAELCRLLGLIWMP